MAISREEVALGEWATSSPKRSGSSLRERESRSHGPRLSGYSAPSDLSQKSGRSRRRASRGSRRRSCARRTAWVVVPAVDPLGDRRLELFGRAVGPTPQPFVGELGEPALDEVHPRAVGRREVQVEARVAHEPAMDLWRLVGRDVVDDEMDVEVVRNAAVDQVQESAGTPRRGGGRSCRR